MESLDEIRVNTLGMEFVPIVLRKGRVQYRIRTINYLPFDKPLPGIRRLKRLAEKFLHCELDVACRSDHHFLYIDIDSGTSPEDRMAFLGAFYLYYQFQHL